MIITVAIPGPLRRTFDYLPPADHPPERPIAPGIRVRVPFGRQKVVGLVVGTRDQSDQPGDKLRPVAEILDRSPLITPPQLSLMAWAADYYQHPPGDALFAALPALLRRGAEVPDNLVEHWQLSVRGRGLADASLGRAKKQRALVDALASRGPLTPAQLRSAGFSAAVAGALQARQLVEKVTLPAAVDDPPAPLLREPHHNLRRDQSTALDALRPGTFGAYLLFGDTGTGKTELYLQAIAAVLEGGGQALVLVPEISLTPQTLDRFRRRFACPVAVMHSGMTDRQRLQGWADAREGRARIVIGTRSAVFTPLASPGIIILDEEHDASFKQQDGFRYSARDVAVMRASRENIPVILGSATPSLESLANCERGRYTRLDLRERHGAPAPRWELIDLKGTDLKAGFSAPLLAAIDEEVRRGNQALVFLNRRGYAPLLLCHDCGWQAECQRCSARMTAHLGQRQLICHHCESRQPLPRVCRQCASANIQFMGQGTERSEEVLKTLFPDVRIMRLDRDSTRRKGSMGDAIAEIKRNEPCILVGTQMIAKGHHFPGVTLSAILDLDSGLFSTDFRATERMAQLITQVAGRAGRGERPGRVIVQSHYVEHPLVSELMRADYRRFAALLMAERRVQGLPPFAAMAMIHAEASRPNDAEALLLRARAVAEQALPPSPATRYLGPLPAALEKRKGYFRFGLSLYSDNRSRLAGALRHTCLALEGDKLSRNVRWAVDVDPQETA